MFGRITWIAWRLFLFVAPVVGLALGSSSTLKLDLIDHQVWTIAVIMYAGTVLYVIRCRDTMVYGCLEIGVGIGIAWYLANLAAQRVPERGMAGFAAMTALYVIVRGYDNIYKSLTSPNRIRRWNKFFFGKDVKTKL